MGDFLQAIIGTLTAIFVVYLTVVLAFKNEIKKGQWILLELTKRYFVCCFNARVLETNRIKNTIFAKREYLRFMEGIEKEFHDLLKNPFYYQLILNHPDVTFLYYLINSEIVNNTISKSNVIDMQQQTAILMYKLYEEIKADMKKKDKSKKEFKSLDDIIQQYMKNYIDPV